MSRVSFVQGFLHAGVLFMGSYIHGLLHQGFLQSEGLKCTHGGSYVQGFLHPEFLTWRGFHLGVLMFRGSYIRCTFVQRFLQYIQGLLSSTFRSSYVFMGFLYSGALLFKDRFSSGHDVKLLRSCVFIQPAWPALKREGEGVIWARESVWGTRGRKERNACKDAIVFSIFYTQILSVKIVIGQN